MKMKRLLAIILLAICVGATGCASEETNVGLEKETTKKADVDRMASAKAAAEEEKTVAEEMPEEKAAEVIEAEEEVNYRKGYSYFLPTRVKDGIEHGLGFNMPKDYMYNTNESSNAKLVFNNGNEIITVDRNEWYAERYNNYLETGEWEAVWEEKIDKVQDVETLYGTVHVLSGYSELLECTIDNCLLDYDGDMWLIERKQAENAQDIETIIIEMFIPSDKATSNENETNEKAASEVSEDRVKSVRVDLAEMNYTYYLGEIDYVHNIDSFKINQIFGFNIPEGYKEWTSRTSSPEEMPELVTYNMVGVSNNNTGESMYIGLPENTYYLKKFLSSDEYTEGEEIEDFNFGSYTLNELEKGGIVESVYGTARVIYQTATNVDFGNVVKTEIVVFNVNNHDILISYEYPDDETASFEGVLEKILPEMLGQ